jgi:hypothetical protein
MYNLGAPIKQKALTAGEQGLNQVRKLEPSKPLYVSKQGLYVDSDLQRTEMNVDTVSEAKELCENRNLRREHCDDRDLSQATSKQKTKQKKGEN